MWVRITDIPLYKIDRALFVIVWQHLAGHLLPVQSMLEKATSKEMLLSATILPSEPENIHLFVTDVLGGEWTTMQNTHAMFPVIHHVLLWSSYSKGVSLRFEVHVAFEAW